MNADKGGLKNPDRQQTHNWSFHLQTRHNNNPWSLFISINTEALISATSFSFSVSFISSFTDQPQAFLPQPLDLPLEEEGKNNKPK